MTLAMLKGMATVEEVLHAQRRESWYLVPGAPPPPEEGPTKEQGLCGPGLTQIR